MECSGLPQPAAGAEVIVAAAHPAGANMETLVLPRVSVVIVNYNYNDYLEQAVASVSAQTYPNIEIVIVDDKSSDSSPETIDRICARNASIIPVKLTKNGGQSVASFAGLSASSGGYVLFLDADDQLLPECVEAHIYAHLSSRIPVAFTTVDILNHAAGQDINTSHPGFSQYVESESGHRPKAVRRVDKSMPNSWFGQRQPVIDADQMHFVLPPHVDPWVWSPASANCYRRDAVNLLLKEPGLERIRWGTDAYMIRPLSALFGSILIDRPLVRYVIHARNRFVKGAPLNQLHFFDTSATSDDMRTIVRTGFERLMSNAAQDGIQYATPLTFFQALEALTECWPGPKPDEAPGEYYTRQLLANEGGLTESLGAQAVYYAMKGRHLGGLNKTGLGFLWKKRSR